MILTVTLSIREKETPFTFLGATGNIQGDKWEKPIAYDSIAQMFSHIGDDIRDVVLKEQTEKQTTKL